MRPIQILFVDGPTAVGKDHLIDKFIYLYGKRFPNAKITKVRAADIVLQGSAQSEERKYTAYATPLEVVKQVYNGHITLLEHLRVASDLLSEHDLIIVNRSFLSYHIYNWTVLHNTLAEEGAKSTHDTLKCYDLDNYRIEYMKRLHGLCTMFVNVTLPFAPPEEKVALLAERAGRRGDGKPLQTEWFSHLIKSYQTPPRDFLTMFNVHSTLTSDDSKYLLDYHFN